MVSYCIITSQEHNQLKIESKTEIYSQALRGQVVCCYKQWMVRRPGNEGL